MNYLASTIQSITVATLLIIMSFFVINGVISAITWNHDHNTVVHRMDNCFGLECAPTHHVLQSVPLPHFTLHTNTMFQKYISNEYIQHIGPTIEPDSPPPRLLA